jgi:hypothetical protein
MDNTNSQATLNVPELPSNVEALVGTSKTDLLNYVREMISKSQITGINETGAVSMDISALTTKVTALEASNDKLVARTPIKISAAGVSSTVLTVPFAEALLSNLYDVNMVLVGGSGVLPDIGWSVVSGSKTTTQFQVRIQGDATGYTLDFTVTPTHNL